MLFVARQENELAQIKTRLKLTTEAFWEMLGKPGTKEGFRNYLYRQAPEGLIDMAKRLESQLQTPRLKSTGDGKLLVIGSAGAGGTGGGFSDEDFLSVPIEFSNPEWRGLNIEPKGKSAMPYIHPGDTIVTKPTQTFKLGKFMLIADQRDPSRRYVKRGAYSSARQEFYFESVNKEFADITSDQMSEDGCVILGLVIGIISADQRVKIGPYEDGIDREYIEFQLRNRLP